MQTLKRRKSKMKRGRISTPGLGGAARIAHLLQLEKARNDRLNKPAIVVTEGAYRAAKRRIVKKHEGSFASCYAFLAEQAGKGNDNLTIIDAETLEELEYGS